MDEGGRRMKPRLVYTNLYEQRRDDMLLADCWRSENDACFPHFHASIEFVYVESGEMTAILDGQSFRVTAGHMLLTSSYSVHCYRTEENQENKVIIMVIPLPSVPSLQKTLNKKAFNAVLYDAREDQEITTLMKMLPDHWREYNAETCKGFSYAVLGLLMERVGLREQPATQQSGLMREVLMYLQNNYQQPLRMENLARQFGYSKSRFSRLFHDHLGCSLIEYLSVLRCRQAAHLLLESDMTMLDIALNVGFECLRTFYRSFKNCYEMTPTQYIRAHTEK